MTPTNERTTIVIEDMFTPCRKSLAQMVEHEVQSNIFKVSLWDEGSNLPLLNLTVEYFVHDALSTPKTILNTYNTYRDIERAVYDANRSVHRTVRRSLQ